MMTMEVRKMIDYLPGTVLETDWDNPQPLSVLDAVFAGGGLVLSQVCRLSGLEPHTIQNWVKRGFCSSPVAKKYSIRQFCRLVTINLLKDSLSLPQITDMLSYINNSLADESDDTIGDDMLYRYFVTIIVYLRHTAFGEKTLEEAIQTTIASYPEPYSGAKDRLERVLQVMVTAYYANQMKIQAERLLQNLD
jgi:DNA-binding transcriptional MerR regulator